MAEVLSNPLCIRAVSRGKNHDTVRKDVFFSHFGGSAKRQIPSPEIAAKMQFFQEKRPAEKVFPALFFERVHVDEVGQEI